MTTEEWKEKNKERVKISNRNYWKEWIVKNKEKRKRYFRNFERSLEGKRKQLECTKKWKKKNPEKDRIYHKITRAKRKGAEGSHTLQEWLNLKERFNYCCAICKRKEPEIKLTEDHIIPLSKNGSNYIWNIQPLCRSCNSKKFNKIFN